MTNQQPRLEDTGLIRVDVRHDDGEKVVETWDYARGEYTELKRWSE